MRFHCYKIEWDTETDEGGTPPELPSEMTVEVDSAEELADKLSDSTGYCVLSFQYIKRPKRKNQSAPRKHSPKK